MDALEFSLDVIHSECIGFCHYCKDQVLDGEPIKKRKGKGGEKRKIMKTYYRTVKLPIHIEENGVVFDLPVGKRVLTSGVREVNGEACVTVLSTHWVCVPFDRFEGSEPAFGHEPFRFTLDAAGRETK